MSRIEAHADAGLALLRAGVPAPVHDGSVPKGAVPPYVVVYVYRETPDGLVAADKIPLTGRSVAVAMRLYCHCVGANATSSRGIAGRVEEALLDVVPTVAGRECSPIRWLEGQPPQRDESTGVLVVDQVDVYGWTSVPG